MGKTKKKELEKKEFDADSEQRVEMDRVVNRKRYKIAHTFHPVLDEEYFEYAKRKRFSSPEFGFSTDEEYFEYAKRKRVVQKFHGTNNLEVTSEDQELRAAEWLWDKLIVKREGYKEDADWRQRVAIQEKRAAIHGLLLRAINGEAGDETIVDAEEGELIDDLEQDAIETVVILEVLHDGKGLETRHYFAPPSAQEVEEFYRITNRSMRVGARVRGLFKKRESAEVHVVSQAKALTKLYDKLIEKTDGYKGRVPAYHKDITVSEAFAQEAEVREKN